MAGTRSKPDERTPLSLRASVLGRSDLDGRRRDLGAARKSLATTVTSARAAEAAHGGADGDHGEKVRPHAEKAHHVVVGREGLAHLFSVVAEPEREQASEQDGGQEMTPGSR